MTFLELSASASEAPRELDGFSGASEELSTRTELNASFTKGCWSAAGERNDGTLPTNFSKPMTSNRRCLLSLFDSGEWLFALLVGALCGDDRAGYVRAVRIEGRVVFIRVLRRLGRAACIRTLGGEGRTFWLRDGGCCGGGIRKQSISSCVNTEALRWGSAGGVEAWPCSADDDDSAAPAGDGSIASMVTVPGSRGKGGGRSCR